MKVRCDVWIRSDRQCHKNALYKVPMYGWDGPYCVCGEHVQGWNESQPHNVKALSDDTPWENKTTGYHRDSRLSARKLTD